MAVRTFNLMRIAAAAGLACLASACVTTAPTLSPSGFTAREAAPVSPVIDPAPFNETDAGFEIVGAQFRASIVFRDVDGRASAQFHGEGFRAGPVDAELDLSRPWISDGERVFAEGGPMERVHVSLRARPCGTPDGVWAREALVLVGRQIYHGCARETGPVPSWTENLPALMADITACVSAARNSSMAFVRGSGQAHVLHAGQERAGTRVRMRFGESGRWDCLAGSAGPEFSVVSDRAAPVPGEADPVFMPGAMPTDGDGCYLYEAVEDASGALIGALAHDVCATGALAMAPAGAQGDRM
ncbi:MAG: hypothetical protein GC187_10135 [Alphaproteobacteria bacterium]|nr:hypothetical protein [Alphaproteobacteria bacterium]